MPTIKGGITFGKGIHDKRLNEFLPFDEAGFAKAKAAGKPKKVTKESKVKPFRKKK